MFVFVKFGSFFISQKQSIIPIKEKENDKNIINIAYTQTTIHTQKKSSKPLQLLDEYDVIFQIIVSNFISDKSNVYKHFFVSQPGSVQLYMVYVVSFFVQSTLIRLKFTTNCIFSTTPISTSFSDNFIISIN
eukprot:298390_1